MPAEKIFRLNTLLSLVRQHPFMVDQYGIGAALAGDTGLFVALVQALDEHPEVQLAIFSRLNYVVRGDKSSIAD